MKTKIIFALLLISLLFVNSNDVDAQSCSEGSYNCIGGNQNKCVSGNWKIWNTCFNGCSNGYCNPAAQQSSGLPPAPVATCSEGSYRCNNDNQERCSSGNWRVWNTCYNGCSGGYCNPAPQQPSGLPPAPAPTPAPTPPPAQPAPAAQPSTVTKTVAVKQISPIAGCSNVKPYDLIENNLVEFNDFVEFVKKFKNNDKSVDYNNDNTFDVSDFYCFKSYFGGVTQITLGQCLASNSANPNIDNDMVVGFSDWIKFAGCMNNPISGCDKFDFNSNGVIDTDADLTCFKLLYTRNLGEICNKDILERSAVNFQMCKGYTCGNNEQCGPELFCSNGRCCAEGERWVVTDPVTGAGSCQRQEAPTCGCFYEQEEGTGKFFYTISGGKKVYGTSRDFIGQTTCWTTEQICLFTKKLGREGKKVFLPRSEVRKK